MPPRLDVLVAGTQDVRGDDLDRPEQATTAGITRVLPLEVRGLTARRIDLDPAGTPVGQLLAELAAEPAAETVALRGGRRWVREFTDITLPAASESGEPGEPGQPVHPGEPILREGGRYLITGGLGGVGLTLAADLARRFLARIVLLSRTGLPPKEEPQTQETQPDQHAAARAAISDLEQAGAQVQVIAADVSDPGAMARVRDQVTASLGGLDGIVHAAGVAGGGLAELKDEAVARAVLEPKLAGTLVLLATLGPITADFIALCSSVTAVTGGVGQVDYCAANAFLDAVARSAHGQRCRVISLNWGGWSEVGMLAKAMDAEDPRPRRPLAVDHPLLRTAARTADQVRADGTISARTDWVLGEHTIGGQPVLPGTAHLELARAVANLTGPADGGLVELRDVVFTEPFAVPDVADFSVTLERGRFQVTSGRKSFSQGIAGIIEAGRNPAVDVAAIRARCRPVADAAWETGRTSAVSFGPRWDCLKQVWIGEDEELGLIEAPAQVAAELDRWWLHPALLDVATAFGMSKRDGAYLPLGYGRVVVRGPLPARFYSHLRYESAAGGVLSAAVTICDEQGNELVAITDFTLRQVDAQAQPVAGGRAPAPRGAAAAADGLISPADGALAFRLVLAADPGPQVVVTPQGLPQIAARIAREGTELTGDGGTAAAVDPGGAASGGDGDSLEDKLIRIWAEVLGVAPSSVSDDFFDLGGNSLVAVGLIGTVREAFGVRLPMRILFESPTVAGLAAQIRRMQAEQGPDDPGAAVEEQIPTIPRRAG
jgi:NAD(P)-dependent dehydrogenase (short-subunit alcohol dehydrogenase family)/acyl carrier protein